MTDKLINVEVETMDGEEVTIRINVENRVEKLMRDAIRELGIESEIGLYDLTLNDQRLDPSSKVETTGIKDGTRVLLERRPKVG